LAVKELFFTQKAPCIIYKEAASVAALDLVVPVLTLLLYKAFIVQKTFRQMYFRVVLLVYWLSLYLTI